MAVKTREELLETFKGFMGEELGDDKIAFLEDFTDTVSDLETKAKGDGTDWKAKYEENDKMWKQKYTERFFSGENPAPDNNPSNDEDKTDITINDLFK